MRSLSVLFRALVLFVIASRGSSRFPSLRVTPPDSFNYTLKEESLKLIKVDDGRKSQPGLGSRVAFGTPASSRDFPSYVFLEVIIDGERFVCGGTLIRPNAVLTAAHCHGKNARVYMGDVKHSFGRVSSRVSSPVQRFILHPKFVANEERMVNDIAIAILSKPINGYPLAKLSKATPRTRSTVTVIGMGKTESQNLAQSLRKTTMTVQERSKCKTGSLIASSEQICLKASPVKPGKYREICGGDSGGPAYYKGVQVGVTSWGNYNDIPCGNSDYAAYSDIGFHYDSFIVPTLQKYAGSSGGSGTPSPASKPRYNAYIIQHGGKLLSMDIKDCSSVEVFLDSPRPDYKGQLWQLDGQTIFDVKSHRISSTERGNCNLKNAMFLTANNGDPVQSTCPDDEPDNSDPPPSNPPPSDDEDYTRPPPSNPPPSDGDYSDGDYSGRELSLDARASSSIQLYIQERCGRMSQAWMLDSDWDDTDMINLFRVRSRNPDKTLVSTSVGMKFSSSGSSFRIIEV